MFKKSIAVFAALLLMSSSLSANNNSNIASENVVIYENCFGVALFVYNQAIAAGASVPEAVQLSNLALKNCVANNPW